MLVKVSFVTDAEIVLATKSLVQRNLCRISYAQDAYDTLKTNLIAYIFRNQQNQQNQLTILKLIKSKLLNCHMYRYICMDMNASRAESTWKSGFDKVSYQNTNYYNL